MSELLCTNASQGTFFDRHIEEIDTALRIVGQLEHWRGDLDSAVAQTQPWVNGDYGKGDSLPFGIDDEQSELLREQYPKLGIVNKTPLAEGDYDTVLMFGAVHLGNTKRTAYVAEEAMHHRFGRVVLLGGERHIFENELDDFRNSITAVEGIVGDSDDWFKNLKKRFQADEMQISESDMIRLAAMQYLNLKGRSEISFPLRKGNPVNDIEGLLETRRPLWRYDFEPSDGLVVSMTHSGAHARKGDKAKPRHTTESCTRDWLYEFEPEKDARIAVIGSQPHTQRMALTVSRTLHRAGRSDIEVVAGGPSSTGRTGHTFYLGEVARTLFETKQLAASSS